MFSLLHYVISYRITDNKCLLSYMKTSFLSLLDTLPYFTIEAAKQLLGDESITAGSIQTMLYRWMKTGKILRLKKGVYMTRRFYELHRADADFHPAVSAILIPQSYNSLEYILQRHGILTDITYSISSVTLKQTRVIENKLATFSFRNIKNDLYAGFTISNYLGIPFARATLAKALFDYFYLRPLKGENWPANYNISEHLRLNLEDFAEKDQSDFAGFVEMSKSKKMNRILKNLRKTVWRP